MKFILISTLICLSLIPVFPSYALHGEDYHCMNEGDCPLESYLQISIVPIVIIIIIVVIIKKKNKDTSSQSPFQTKDDEQKGSDRRIRHHSEYAKKYSLDEMRKKFDKEISSEREKIDAKWKEKFDKEFSSNKNTFKLLSIIIVFIISFIALIIILDTFKGPITKIIPNIEFLLYNFYESIKDTISFFRDLIQ